MFAARKLSLAAALSLATLAVASPASAAQQVVQPSTNPCSTSYVSGAIACQGYYGRNLLQGEPGSNTSTEVRNILTLLLNGTPSTTDSTPTRNTSAYTGNYGSLDTSKILATISPLNGAQVIDFGTFMMSGLTVVGIHFGNNSDPGAEGANNFTGFWLVDLGQTSTNRITLASSGGTSNAQIFATTVPAVPEPSTWAMLLLGFGVIGTSMRRRRSSGRLLQAA